MIDTPHILEVGAQPIAMIHLTVPASDMQKVMGPAITELFSTLQAQGIKPVGPWLTYHLRMQPGVFDFQVAVPVTQSVVPTGRVANGELPAATVARTIYHGPYEGLPEAWPKLDAWLTAQGHQRAGWLWETYLVDPSKETEPAKWQTELSRPLLK
jgi:effector-binding domain-containing protein